MICISQIEFYWNIVVVNNYSNPLYQLLYLTYGSTQSVFVAIL